jgi:hypothetical protein
MFFSFREKYIGDGETLQYFPASIIEKTDPQGITHNELRVFNQDERYPDSKIPSNAIIFKLKGNPTVNNQDERADGQHNSEEDVETSSNDETESELNPAHTNGTANIYTRTNSKEAAIANDGGIANDAPTANGGSSADNDTSQAADKSGPVMLFCITMYQEDWYQILQSVAGCIRTILELQASDDKLYNPERFAIALICGKLYLL